MKKYMNVRLYESKLYITFNEKYLYKTIHITHKTSSVHVLEEKFSIDFYRFDKDVKKIMIKKIRTENTTIPLES